MEGPPSRVTRRRLREYLREGYSGSRRGDALFIEFPADLHGGGLVDPEMMHPKALRDYVQEMVCSIYGYASLPCCNSASDLEAASQNATMMQLEKQAWETGMLGRFKWRLASQIGRQLLPAFGLDASMYRLGFDTSTGLRCCNGTARLRQRCGAMLVRDGIVLRSQALEALGLPFDAMDEVRHMPISVIEVPGGTSTARGGGGTHAGAGAGTSGAASGGDGR